MSQPTSYPNGSITVIHGQFGQSHLCAFHDCDCLGWCRPSVTSARDDELLSCFVLFLTITFTQGKTPVPRLWVVSSHLSSHCDGLSVEWMIRLCAEPKETGKSNEGPELSKGPVQGWGVRGLRSALLSRAHSSQETQPVLCANGSEDTEEMRDAL